MPTKASSWQPEEVVKTLREHAPDVFDVRPCWVKIRRTVYPACQYSQQRANLNTGEDYTQTMIYCCGLLPADYLRSSRIVFISGGEERYVAAYWPQKRNAHQKTPNVGDPGSAYHPLGAMFLLTVWDAPEKIDQYEPRPYKRVPITITFEGEVQ